MDEENKNPGNKEAAKQRRVTKACDSCCKKRRKCTGTSPCEFCEIKGIECTYLQPAKKRGPQTGIVFSTKPKELENILYNIDDFTAPSPSLSSESSNPLSDNNKFGMVKPLVPPKYNPPMIPFEIVKPTINKWKHDTFPPIEIGNGQTRPWLDVFFENGHMKVPILSPKWIYQNYYDLPLYLIHSMYALALTTPVENIVTYNAGDYHYSIAMLYHKEYIQNPTPFDVLATFNLGCYALMSTDALTGGIAKVALAIQMARKLKIDTAEHLTWTNQNGRMFGNDLGTGKIFLRLLWYSLYENDYYFSFVQHIPFEINSEVLHLEFPPNSAMVYSDFHSSGIWYWFFSLLKIGRKIILLLRNDYTDRGDFAYLIDKEKLTKDLETWFQSLPAHMSKRSDTYTRGFEDGSNWMVAYVQCYYYHLFIILQRSTFLALMEANQTEFHPAVKMVLDYSTEITRITFLFQNYNPDFVGVSPYLFYIIFLAASSFCISIPVIGRTDDLLWNVNVLIKACDDYSRMAPVMSLRADMIRNWLSDPVKYTELYGTTI
jgi:hypothetical protein